MTDRSGAITDEVDPKPTPEPRRDALVVLRDVWRVFAGPEGDVTALAGVNLTVERGSYVAIMGPSGSGKSTLLNILGCLDTPSRGSYLLDGEPVEKLSDDALARVRNEKLGFVFQAFHLLPSQTAIANVKLPLVYSRRFPNRHDERAAAALALVDLKDRMLHYPRQLSGGQKQRVALARALVADPVVLLADEPTGALDSKSTRGVLELFNKLHRMGRTIIVVTHAPDVAVCAQRLVMIRDGRVVADGRPRPVLQRHANILGIAAEDADV